MKVLRYIVYPPDYNPDLDFVASYNEGLGRPAYQWALQNARTYFGTLVEQYADGTLKIVKSFQRKARFDDKPATNSV